MRLGAKDALYLLIIFLLIVQLWSVSHENERLREEQRGIKETLVTSQLIHEIFELRRHAKLTNALMDTPPGTESKLALLIELNNTKYSLSRLERDVDHLGAWLGYENDSLSPSGGDCVELLEVVYYTVQSENMTHEDVLLASNGLDTIINFTRVYPPTYGNIIQGLSDMNKECRRLLQEANRTQKK
ncbi:hypothetical protein E3E35_06400 [Thermococcus sp. GR7]|uniref:hypothetical protein n=1 Tax=unclassified Thermococcus TaxID=2627626 RepID=UPI0014314B1D|nr:MULTISPECIES: hypothetical protein [unclassified Thermococcus]NJE47040.1 hypothetical protein [Thermococcus sp. GR7]NJE78135.1 hypothetical protein [Thermococcus sp. GR4]NJF22748.1 hypothetical protein [Thermococcus sp. GR5]